MSCNRSRKVPIRSIRCGSARPPGAAAATPTRTAWEAPASPTRARGSARGTAPLILGYQAFDRDINIAGVILNNLGGSRHEAKLRAVIEHYTNVPVIGAIHHDERLSLVA